MSGLIRFLTIIAISLLLHACGGGNAETPWDTTTTDGTTTTTDGTTTDGGTTVTAIYLGSGSGASFSAGVLNISVTSLSAGGSTTVTATLADVDGNLHQESASVSFTSNCVASNLAAITSPISTDTGVVTTTYDAQGCSGSDTITATATVNGATRTATGTLTVQPAIIGSMQFVSATPSTIGISGFGLTEVAEVVFRVLDTNGNPVSNQLVNFSLNSSVGGVNLPNTSDTSDSSGLVRADVQSGTVPTTVRVTASLASNPLISTQSDGLTISTGIADQNSISLSLSTLNPEALTQDGETVVATVYAADHFGNPVADGTAVYFTVEGGQVQPQCLTTDGRCSVNWTSSNPRPQYGRATILATITGEESFVDANGNGIFESGETFFDMPEAFRDDNENDAFDAGAEEFLDFNSSGNYDTGDGVYNGVLCTSACSSEKNIHVRASGVIVMAASGLTLYVDQAVLNGPGETVDSSATAYVFWDQNGDNLPSSTDQVPPKGTVITLTATNGSLESPASVTVPNTNDWGPYSIPIRWRGDATSSSGTLRIQAVVPSGLTTLPVYLDLND